jgi:hypothetical protein
VAYKYIQRVITYRYLGKVVDDVGGVVPLHCAIFYFERSHFFFYFLSGHVVSFAPLIDTVYTL